MDAQQELFSALLVALREYYGAEGVEVYDTFLPPDGVPYPFVYLADSTLVDDYGNKDMILGTVSQTIHVWHDDPKRRGDVSAMLYTLKRIARSITRTDSYTWAVRGINQRILPDDTTKTPLLHGVLEVDYEIMGGKN